MALLFMDGFDAGDFKNKWDYWYNFGTTTSTRFSSGFAAITTLTNLGGYMVKNVTASSEVYIGFAYKNDNSTYFGEILRLFGDTGTTEHIHLNLLDSATIVLYRGTTSLGTASLSQGIWCHVEVAVNVSDTVGFAKVKVNGVEVISYSGDTKNGGINSTIDKVQIGQYSTGGKPNSVFDDLYICDSIGTTNNTFLGDVRVQTLVPNAAGLSTQFTPTGGANYANVADIPDSAATYNSSSTQGHRDTYAFSDLVAGTGTVFGIQTNMHAKKADAGLGPLKEAVVAGSTVYYGNTTQLPTSTAWIGQIRETNPDTSTAWTVGDVNSLEAGAEVA